MCHINEVSLLEDKFIKLRINYEVTVDNVPFKNYIYSYYE